MKFEECKDKIKGSWVKISDVQLSLPASGYAYMEADVHIPSGVMIMDIEEYTKHVQEEYKEMVLAVLSMGFVDLGVCFGSSNYTCLRKILEDHPDPLGAYQRWKAKKDAAKEMTIEEIEAKLGYKIKVVGKEE